MLSSRLSRAPAGLLGGAASSGLPAFPRHGLRPNRLHQAALTPAEKRKWGGIRASQTPAQTTLPNVASTEMALAKLGDLASLYLKLTRGRELPTKAGGPAQPTTKLLLALRLAMVWMENVPPRKDGRPPLQRGLMLAAVLLDLSQAGVPIDVDSVAAALIADCAADYYLPQETIRLQLGDEVAVLVHDILRVRTAPQRVELFDDAASSAIREWCIAFNDVRAVVVEVVGRWDELRCMGALPAYERQALALEALQVYAPLGHALGLGAVSANMEDACFRVLFPSSYTHTSEWLRAVVDPAESALYAAQQQLLEALDAHPRFGQLASGCVLRTRTKSLFSMMRKLLRLGDLGKGGRRREEIYDLLGMRAVVQPRADLPPDEAEALAEQACYVVQEVAGSLWRVVPSRTKDYITRPKANGYRCIHLTVEVSSVIASQAAAAAAEAAAAGYGAGAGAAQEGLPEGSAGTFGSQGAAAEGAGPAGADQLQEAARAAAADWQQQGRGYAAGAGGQQDYGPELSMDSAPLFSMDLEEGSLPSVDFSAFSGMPGSYASSPSSSAPEGGGSSGSMSGGEGASGVGGDELGAGGGGLVVAPFMELQIRTQGMDERAEKGDAAHTAYKGGLDSRQARQLQAWTRELQHRLAVRPQGKLLLPPSVVAKSEGALSVLESVDLDLELEEEAESEEAVTYDVGGASGGGSYSSSGGEQGADDAASGGAVSRSQLSSASQPAAASQLGGGKRGASRSGAEALFTFLDRNGDGRVSVDELRQQFAELAGASVRSTGSTGGAGFADFGAGAFGGMGMEGPAWASPYGAISFDPAADMSALSMGSLDGLPYGYGSAGGGHGLGLDPYQQQQLQQQVVGGYPASWGFQDGLHPYLVEEGYGPGGLDGLLPGFPGSHLNASAGSPAAGFPGVSAQGSAAAWSPSLDEAARAGGQDAAAAAGAVPSTGGSRAFGGGGGLSDADVEALVQSLGLEEGSGGQQEMSMPQFLTLIRQAVQARARAKQLKKQQEGQQGGSPDAGWSNSGGTGGG